MKLGNFIELGLAIILISPIVAVMIVAISITITYMSIVESILELSFVPIKSIIFRIGKAIDGYINGFNEKVE